MLTPGHSDEDITTLVQSDEGLVVCTHLWWSAEARSGPFARDQALLERSRELCWRFARLIVPGTRTVRPAT